MLATFLIGLREGLEATLVVVVLIAYLVKSGRRHLVPRIWAGIALAVGVSLAFGALLTWGPKGLTFEAQEAIGGTLSLVAVGFVTWMIFWMAGHARQMSGELRGAVDRAADAGRLSLVLVAVLAVGREGLETALFLWASTRAAGGGSAQPILGALLGLAAAVLLGRLIYRGALRLNLGTFFTWTGYALVLVAAGVLAYGIHDLQEASILPGLNHLAFDVEHVIRPDSVLGTVLKGTINFTPRTTVLQAVAWLLYVIPVLTLLVRRHRARPGAQQTRPLPAKEAVSA